MVDLQSPVGGVFVIHAVIHNISALITTWNKPKGQDVQRDRQELHDRLDERVDQTEDHRDDEDDAGPLQLRVTAYEAHPVHEECD